MVTGLDPSEMILVNSNRKTSFAIKTSSHQSKIELCPKIKQ